VNPEPKATVGGLEYKHFYYLNSSGRELELELWDIAGGISFRNMTSLYFRDADAAILVFDVTDRASFESLKDHWLKDLREKGRDQIIVAVVGNKMDLDEEQGQVKEEEARNILGVDLIEMVSAKKNKGLNQLFQRLGEKLVLQKP
jgi:small GTP-binding protein